MLSSPGMTKTNTEHSDFRYFITRALADRRAQYPTYSLRAFAKSIGMSPQKLNSILNRNAGLSLKAAIELSKKLSLSEADKNLFLALVEAHHSRSLTVRKLAKDRLNELQEFDSNLKLLNENEFEKISTWLIIAIYLLPDLKEFKPDINWIAARLQISMTEAETAVQCLFNNGYLELGPNNEWLQTSKKLAFFAKNKSPALRTYRKDLIEKAKIHVDSDELNNKCFNEIVVPIAHDDLEYIRNEFSDFQKKIFSRLANRTGSADQIYTIMLNAFPIDFASTKGPQ